MAKFKDTYSKDDLISEAPGRQYDKTPWVTDADANTVDGFKPENRLGSEMTQQWKKKKGYPTTRMGRSMWALRREIDKG